MTSDGGTYLLPGQMEPELDRIHAYWNGLKRGENDIPFWDDVKFSMQAPLARDIIVFEVFDNPLRFRFDLIGDDITRQYGAAINGKFSDEIDLHPPFDDLAGQCRATVEGRAPTYFRHAPAGEAGPAGGSGYSRLILPLWGNGRIEMLIGAVAANSP